MNALFKQALVTLASITIVCTTIIASAQDILQSGQQLYPYDSLDSSSHSGSFRLVMQPDGNLVLYSLQYGDSSIKVLWQTGTSGKNVAYCIMQTDGNLVLIGANGNPVWDSNTAGNPGAFLILQSNGDLVIDKPEQIWAANPNQKPQPPRPPICPLFCIEGMPCPTDCPPIGRIGQPCPNCEISK